MSAQPMLPSSAPFAHDQIEALNGVFARTNPEQRSWLAGFLAGYQAATTPALPGTVVPASATQPKRPLTILYGTESGNSEGVAAAAKKASAQKGFVAKLVDMADIGPGDLAKVENLLVIASTWGEGDPPERAAAFYQALLAPAAPRLAGLRFAVLALGDSSYVNYCAVGKTIDARLAELGAVRIADRVDCDLDFEAPAGAWTERALARLAEVTAGEGARGADVIHVDFQQPAQSYSKSAPFPAPIKEMILLNSSASDKETWHVELGLDGANLSYEPGDALGIVPQNDPDMAWAVRHAARLEGDAVIDGVPVVDVLLSDYDITTLTRPVIEAYAKLTEDKAIVTILARNDLPKFLAERQIVDFLEEFPHAMTARQLVSILRKLPPRLFSLASSLKAVPEEAHLLIAAVRYEMHGRGRKGVASTFVTDRNQVGDQLKVYVKPNKYFRLPEAERPIVMVGPGTGVAPFRAFMQERQATGAKGKNWLFFGDRRFNHDFLYQLEWQDYLKDGLLTRLDLAFSRDQKAKLYVQHRMWESRAELWKWLEEGAILFVCGDEKAMAKDVDATLQKIIAETGGRGTDGATAYIAEMKRQNRYRRDVY
ncbi:MAG: sulfite reductase subunit alpha [Alphaproteobacteria bacterium]|nr:sulfite reductase subunit alpha [Alphaproteobacteria bacterium]